MTWRTQAACRGHDTNIFFDPDRVNEALALCDGCPVQHPCRTEGAAEEGIWGGIIPGPGPVWANRPGVRVGDPRGVAVHRVRRPVPPGHPNDNHDTYELVRAIEEATR